jgi:ketosteroid isomerase-like protein
MSLAALPVAAQTPPVEADAFVRDFYAAYGARDTGKLAGFYAGDATFVDPTFELDLKGPEQIGNLLAIALAKYESLSWEIAHTFVAGDDVVVEGTMVGKLVGKTARVRFVSVFHFTRGKIAAQRDMFDVMHFYTQLGVVPVPFRPKAPAAKPAGG